MLTSVQASPQPLLIQEMGNQPNTPSEHEQTIEHAHPQVVLSLLWREGAAVAEQINEAHGDAAVHVENEVVLL